MFTNLLAKPTVKVTIEQEMVFVHPSADQSTPSEDPEIRGTVLISLPAKRAISNVRVVLEGACDVLGGTGWQYESTTTLEKHLDLELNGEVLEAGNHAFNFVFIVPSSTAVYQRSNYGRVRHWVKATVNFASSITPACSSPSVAVWITAHPEGSEPPLPLEIAIEHFSEALGPLGIRISSPHLTIASLLSLRVAIPSPPQPTTILSISCEILQSFTIHYISHNTATPPPKSFELSSISPTPTPAPLLLPPGTKDIEPAKDGEPLTILGTGEEFKWARVMRVPNDDFVRPSTLDGTVSAIRVSHKLVVKVRFQREEDTEPQAIMVMKPVTIISCCHLSDSGFLPAYSRTAPKTVVRPIGMRCQCNLSLKEMFDRDGSALERAGDIGAVGNSRTLGVDKSPEYHAPVEGA